MKDTRDKINPDASRRVSVKKAGNKEVEVKSIKIIQENADYDAAQRRKLTFDLNGKQKEEIKITISPERIKEMEKEKRKAEKEHKANRRRAARTKAQAQRHAAIKGGGAEAQYKNEFMFINVCVIIIVISALTFSLVFLKRSSGFSQSENRDLYTFPKFSVESYFNGEFTKGITNFFTDTVPSREKLKSLTKDFKSMLGISLSNASVAGNVDSNVKHEEFTGTVNTGNVSIYTGGKPSTDGTDTDNLATTPEGTTTKKTENSMTKPEIIDKIENGILVINKGTDEVRAMELYGGSFTTGKKFAEVLNSYKKDLGDYVNVYNMCIPMAVAYYLPEEFEDQSASVIDNINNIRSYLSGVADVDAYSALLEHKDEYIYSRTDHHWQPLGAYYAAKVFAETAFVDFADLSTYEKLVKDEFVGTLYGSSGDEELNRNPDTFTYYKPSNEYTTYYYNTDFTGKEQSTLFFDFATGINTYSVFLGKDNIVTQIDTDVTNGRTLVIYKDSFGNALVPFLTGSFEHIYVCDYRYSDFNAIEFCNQVGATDVLFATSLFTSTSSSKVDQIEYNRVR